MSGQNHLRLLTKNLVTQGKIPLILGLGLGMLVLLEFNPLAQAQTVVAQSSQEQQLPSEAKIIHINPNTGNDQKGNGTENLPFKTITQALMLAKPKTVIMLAPGTYNAETGENFPLQLKTEVTIQGNPENQGQDVIIEGSGVFISPTSAGQHVTIVAMDKAVGLTGVTVINPHSQGYGVWIESANPQVSYNTFIRSGHAGISVNGDSAPLIADNYFYNNDGNGLVIYGNSRPQLQDNVFEKTGFGVSVLQDAAPVLQGNRFLGNRIGLILQGNSQATLRNNRFEMSLEDGIVAISHARPDLGTANQPGGNTFQANRGLDIKNLSPEQSIPAFGNQINGSTSGKIDLAGTSQRIEPVVRPSRLLAERNLAANGQNASAANDQNLIAKDLSVPPLTPLLLAPGETADAEATLPPAKVPAPPKSPANPATANSLPAPPIPPSTPPARANSLPAPPQRASTPVAINPLPKPSTPSATADSSPKTPPANVPVNRTRQDLSELLLVSPNLIAGANRGVPFKSDTIPVPNAEIPTGNVAQTPINAYRVMAETLNKQQEQQLRSLYPDAFNTAYNGQPMWQVGVFSSQESASQVLDKLNDLGLSGLVVRF